MIDPLLPLACSHRPPCPGCPRFGESGVARVARDALDELAVANGLPHVTVSSGAAAGFRLRARLAIRGRAGAPKVGLFELGTHRVVHVPHCVVHHPLINRVASVVRRALAETRVTSYSDQAHLGTARYLQVVIERSSQTAQVVLVANSPSLEPPLAACFELIRERLGRDLHSLWFNAHCDVSNAVLGPDFERCAGPESVVERFGGAAVHYPPAAFGQSNLDIAERIIEHVRAHLPPAARVMEFYAGVGAIGLSLLAQTSALVLNEIGAQSLRGLELGLAALGADERAKITVVPGAAAGALTAATDAPAGATAQVVIADPPRRGLDPELMQHLAENPPDQFVYVSCGLESLLRDTQRLLERRTLRLSALSAFNLMPYTEHVETVARFARIG